MSEEYEDEDRRPVGRPPKSKDITTQAVVIRDVSEEMDRMKEYIDKNMEIMGQKIVDSENRLDEVVNAFNAYIQHKETMTQKQDMQANPYQAPNNMNSLPTPPPPQLVMPIVPQKKGWFR